MSFILSLFRRIIERSGRKRTLPEWQAALAKSGAEVHGRYQASSSSDKHHQIGRHIIGIERWGQSRLRVFLGEALQMDEYDTYQPAADAEMAALGQLFHHTRQETIALARQLQEAGTHHTQTVPHNNFGDLTLRGWLAYLNTHASRESQRL